MVKLNVPYRSQWDNDANKHNAGCGPTCVAMILKFYNVDIQNRRHRICRPVNNRN